VVRLQELLRPTEDLLSEIDRPWMQGWLLNRYLPELCHRERNRVYIDTGRYFYWTQEVERETQNVCAAMLNGQVSEFIMWGIHVDVDDWHRSRRLDIDAFCDASRCFDLLPVADRNLLKAEYMMVPTELRPLVVGATRSFSRSDVLRILGELRNLMNGVHG
jgi:hypothetical protein